MMQICRQTVNRLPLLQQTKPGNKHHNQQQHYHINNSHHNSHIICNDNNNINNSNIQLNNSNNYASTYYYSYFPVCRANKPSYEQIFDCITSNNVKQLKKYLLDGFGSQVYTWRKADIAISEEMRLFLYHIPDYQVSVHILYI